MRPVILLGNGMRHSPEMLEYLTGLGIPVLTTWMAADLIPEDHPAFCGRPGIYGQRAANIIQQKASHLFCYGARLDEGQVAYRYDKFAPNAIKFVWDCDSAEEEKLPSDWQRLGNASVFPVVDPDWGHWHSAVTYEEYQRIVPQTEHLDHP